jgi:hypothetical protein
MNQAHAMQVRARHVSMDGAPVHPRLRESL